MVKERTGAKGEDVDVLIWMIFREEELDIDPESRPGIATGIPAVKLVSSKFS